MIIVDKALRERHEAGRPVRVGLIGSGFMGRGIALQIAQSVPGMEVAAIYSRSLDDAGRAYAQAGVADPVAVDRPDALDRVVEGGGHAVSDDPEVLCDAACIDAIVEVTGTVEFAAGVVERAIAQGKHVVLMNAELDGTIGPILKHKADRAGVILTNVDGDQPGVIMNLYRFVRGIGVRPVLCGNIKGLQDKYRNPTTQAEFARRWGQSPEMVTSFADGTKISFEQAIVANATGMRVARRGMHGPTVEPGVHIRVAAERFSPEELLQGDGIVDYVVGAEPAPGVFVLGTHDDPVQRHYLELYKLGTGPLYCFYTPYHLCHFEVPWTVARAVLFKDAAIAAIAGPRVDVVATAKIDLPAGQVLDGMGGYMTYGQAENSDVAARERLLPMGLAEGCRLTRAVAKDEVLSYRDVAVPPDRLSDRLRAEQNRLFGLD